MNDYLIVIDMQNDFIDGSLGTAEAASIVPEVVSRIRDHSGPVIFTFDTHGADYPGTLEGKKLPVLHCRKGSDGWQLHPMVEALRLEKNGKCFYKPAFGSRELAEFLWAEQEKRSIDSITLIGLCTDICVISNALTIKSFLPEIPVRVEAACCAGVTPESHERALAAMEACQIEVSGRTPATS